MYDRKFEWIHLTSRLVKVVTTLEPLSLRCCPSFPPVFRQFSWINLFLIKFLPTDILQTAGMWCSCIGANNNNNHVA